MHLDAWDYITFGVFAVIGASVVALILLIGGLPGRIAIARKHPEADAVRVMGWAGLLAVVPWMQAFIWAFKPTNVVDLRRGPKEEQKAIEEEWLRLTADQHKRRRRKQPDGDHGPEQAPPQHD